MKPAKKTTLKLNKFTDPKKTGRCTNCGLPKTEHLAGVVCRPKKGEKDGKGKEEGKGA